MEISLRDINLITPSIRDKIKNKMSNDPKFVGLSDDALEQIELIYLRSYLKHKVIPLTKSQFSVLKENLLNGYSI